MNELMSIVEILVAYSLRITPGLVLLAAVFMLVPTKQVLMRIMVLILGFVLMRDAMTPEGLWQFGITDTAVWIRFINDPWILLVLAGMSGLIVYGLQLIPSLKKLVRWGDLRDPKIYLVGITGAIAVAAPFVLLAQPVDMAQRGGEVAGAVVLAVLVMALVGNLLEELLFRGYLQSFFEKHTTALRAALISGVTFAAAHTYLASTVTDLGWPLLAFVLLEGLTCAFIYLRCGLVASALTHGLAIFILASGLL